MCSSAEKLRAHSTSILAEFHREKQANEEETLFSTHWCWERRLLRSTAVLQGGTGRCSGYGMSSRSNWEPRAISQGSRHKLHIQMVAEHPTGRGVQGTTLPGLGAANCWGQHSLHTHSSLFALCCLSWYPAGLNSLISLRPRKQWGKID